MARPQVTSNLLRWLAIGALLPLLSCSRPPSEERVPCSVTVQPGASIQAALDGAPPGAVICLPAGTWTENLDVTKPVTLRGAGPARTVIRGKDLARPVLAVASPEGTVILAGIALAGATGACSEPAGCAHGLLVSGRATVAAERCTFSGNTGSGVAVRDQARVELRDSTLTGNIGYGLHVQDRGEVVLTSVTVSENRSTGIWIADQAHLRIASSTVTKSEGHGLWVRGESRLTATDSVVSSCAGHGLWVQDRASADLSGCQITNHRDSGLWVEHSAQVALSSCTIAQTWDGAVARNNARLQVQNSTVSAVRWDGIKLQGTAAGSVVGSALRGGRGSGIHVGGAAQVEIRDNRIESWIAHGVLGLSPIPPTGDGNRFANNGVDLSGNVPSTLRVPLSLPDQEVVRFPNRDHTTLQQAVDAVRPGGRLILAEGIYTGGITLGKPLWIESEGIVLLTAKSGGESPVLSLIDGADLVMSGVALGYGSEGIVLGGNARAALTDCVISDNVHGVHATGTARVTLVRCSLSRNQQGGVWLWENVHGDIRETSFTSNGLCGIGLGGSSTTSIERCRITESGWTAGVAVRDSAQVHLVGNTIVGNYGVGVALYHELCVGPRYVFTGRVTGGGNVFANNNKGPVCPAELAFLWGEGGELDFRR